MFALFESIGGIELIMVGVAALLLFGKDLPKVAADAGAQFAKIKRSLNSTWRDSGLEREVRQIRESLPRDLSLADVARTASEKLSVRLEEEERVRNADPGLAGPVARGSVVPDVLPEPIDHGTTPPRDLDADGPPRPPTPPSSGPPPSSDAPPASEPPSPAR